MKMDHNELRHVTIERHWSTVMADLYKGVPTGYQLDPQTNPTSEDSLPSRVAGVAIHVDGRHLVNFFAQRRTPNVPTGTAVLVDVSDDDHIQGLRSVLLRIRIPESTLNRLLDPEEIRKYRVIKGHQLSWGHDDSGGYDGPDTGGLDNEF